MTWIKDHIFEFLGLIVAVLNYFKVGPEEFVQALSGISFVFYILAGVLIGWGACKTFYGMKSRKKGMSKKEARAAAEQFRADFVKCPYWIKVFLKAVLEKEPVFSRANDFEFERVQEFLLQFVDYKTVGHDELQFSMRQKARDLFEKNVHMLADVKDEDIRSHARNGPGMYYVHNYSQGIDWWYFSDEDYLEFLRSLG